MSEELEKEIERLRAENKELRASRDLKEGAFDLADREVRLLLLALKESEEKHEETTLILIAAQNPGIDIEKVREERKERKRGR